MAPASPDLGRGTVLLRKDGKTGRCPVYDQASLGTYPLSRRLPLASGGGHRGPGAAVSAGEGDLLRPTAAQAKADSKTK